MIPGIPGVGLDERHRVGWVEGWLWRGWVRSPGGGIVSSMLALLGKTAFSPTLQPFLFASNYLWHLTQVLYSPNLSQSWRLQKLWMWRRVSPWRR